MFNDYDMLKQIANNEVLVQTAKDMSTGYIEEYLFMSISIYILIQDILHGEFQVLQLIVLAVFCALKPQHIRFLS